MQHRLNKRLLAELDIQFHFSKQKNMHSLNAESKLAEDHEFRSRYIHKLVQACRSLPPKTLTDQCSIPKTIIQFWDQSDAIPDDVRECLDSWLILGSRGYQRLLFNDDSARRFIHEAFRRRYLLAFDRCYHPAMRCDYFRLCYLSVCGGFYVDADELYQGVDFDHLFIDNMLKIQPLCYDKEKNEMVSTRFFLKKHNYNVNWLYYLANNPLICSKGHPVICMALERATNSLLHSTHKPEIQSTTGPGNLTASLVRHAIECSRSVMEPDFVILPDWHFISISPWPLSYRNDERNWRFLS